MPLIRTPVPGPGFAPNSTLMRPLDGHAHLGDGCAGISGSGRDGVRDVDELRVVVVRALPLGGVRRMTCPGWISDPSPSPFQRASSSASWPYRQAIENSVSPVRTICVDWRSCQLGELPQAASSRDTSMTTGRRKRTSPASRTTRYQRRSAPLRPSRFARRGSGAYLRNAVHRVAPARQRERTEPRDRRPIRR